MSPSFKSIAISLLISTAAVNSFSINNNKRVAPLQASTTIDITGASPSFDILDKSGQAQESEDDLNVGVLLLNLGGPEKTQDVEGAFIAMYLRHVHLIAFSFLSNFIQFNSIYFHFRLSIQLICRSRHHSSTTISSTSSKDHRSHHLKT